jgi:hypothetical protein
MATTLTHLAGNAACDAIATLLDAGEAILATDADAEVATCALAATAFGAADDGVATAAAISDDEDAAGGEVAVLILVDDAAAEIARCSVSGSEGDGDVKLNTVSAEIPAGAVVGISALTLTVPCDPDPA